MAPDQKKNQYDPNAAADPDAGIFGLPCSFQDAKVVYLPVPWEATTSYGGGTFDCVIEKLDKNGKQLWGSYYGANGNDRSWNLNIDLSGDIYVGGGTSSLTNISTPNAHQTQFGGGLATFSC